MEYALGLDLGGGPGTVAISRPEGVQGYRTEVLTGMGARDGVDRLLERVGDPLGGPRPDTAWRGDAAEAALAELVAAAIEAAAEAHGAPPTGAVVAHPSSWGPYRVGLLRSALAVQAAPAGLVPAAVSAVAHAGVRGTSGSPGPVRAGDLVAVLDVRDEHVEVTVVAAGPDDDAGTTVGVPRVVTDLGSLDVEDAVLAHVRSVLADGAVTVDRTEAARLRAACAQAAAQLLTSAATTVTWQTGDERHEVRVVASEVDARLRPRAARAVAAAADAVAADAPAGIDRVLLIGRFAAMPLLTEQVAERFEAPLTVLAGDSDAVARGAAVLARAVRGVAAEPAASGPRPRAVRGRGAHAQHPPRRQARVAALLGTGVIGLGAAALAVSGAALGAPGGGEDRPAGASSHGPESLLPEVLPDPHGMPGSQAPAATTVLGRPAVPADPAGLPPGTGDGPRALPGPAAGEQQASAG